MSSQPNYLPILSHPLPNTTSSPNFKPPTTRPPLASSSTTSHSQSQAESDRNAKVDLLVKEYQAKADRGELEEDEKMWLSRECIARFVIATKSDLPSTRLRLQNVLSFRRSWNLYDVQGLADEVDKEAWCGKEFLMGFGKGGMPVLYFYPNRNDTEVSERQMKHTVWMMDRTIDLMPAGVSNLILIIDLAGKRQQPTSLAQAKLFVDILGNHYPERLGTAVILNLPLIVRGFLNLVFKFVDPVTKEKVQWDSDFVKKGLIPKSTALKDHHGDLPFTYSHDAYWPMLTKLAVERRTEYKKAWLALGGKVGISEWDYKTYKGEGSGPAQSAGVGASVGAEETLPPVVEDVHITRTAPGPPQGTPHAEPPNPIDSQSSSQSQSEQSALHAVPEESTTHPSPTTTAVSTNLSRSSSNDSPGDGEHERMKNGGHGPGPAGSTLSVISDATLHDEQGNGGGDGELREKMEAVRLTPVIPEGLPVGSAR